MVKPHFLLAALALAAAAPLPAKTMGNYTFTLDGKDYEPGTYCVEMGDVPVPGDVIQVSGIALTLDEPGKYDFRWEEDGLLYRVLAEGAKVPVACRVRIESPDDGRPGSGRLKKKGGLLNPLAKLNDEALRQIRGVTLETWPDGLEKTLARLDLNKVCLSLEREVVRGEGRALPPLPTGLRHLVVSSSGSGGFEDLTQLKALARLRFLDLSSVNPEKFDFTLLQGMPLEYLSLPWTDGAKHVEVLGTLDTLKTLAANSCSYLGTAGWAAGLKELRQFYASRISGLGDAKPVPLDLAVLGSLAKLRAFHVALSPVASLPDKKLPSLEKATLLLSEVDDAQLKQFTVANPQCEVRRSMNATLGAALKPADRVRARTGGLCHREEDREKTIHEVRDPALIAELAQHLEVRDDQGGFHCMCCGNPTFEFYRGDELVAAIGFHHGQSIRWDNGLWPGDAALTGRSAEYLVEWLDRHGYGEPKQAMMEARQQRAAAQRRQQRYEALVPRALADAWGEVEEAEGMTKLLKTHLPDPAQRALLLLKLIGCDNGTWSLKSGFEDLILTTWIPDLPGDAMKAVVQKAAPASEEGQGAARWILGCENVEPWKGQWDVLEPLARFSLAHPRQGNRWRTLAVLRDLKDDPSRQLLLAVVRGEIKPRPLPEEDKVEPGGSQTFYPNAITLPDDAPDALAAALCLAQLKDTASKAEVEKLKGSQPPPLREAFDKELGEYLGRQKR